MWLVCVTRIDAGRDEAREGGGALEVGGRRSVIHCTLHG